MALCQTFSWTSQTCKFMQKCCICTCYIATHLFSKKLLTWSKIFTKLYPIMTLIFAARRPLI
jgi:hypothetical protein